MMLYKLVSEMDRRHFENHVVSMTSIEDLGFRIQELGIRVESLGLRRGEANPAALTRMVDILRRFKPDLLQGWMYHGNLLGLVAGRLVGVPSVYWNIRCSTFRLQGASLLTGGVVLASCVLSSRPDMVVFNSKRGLQLHCAAGYHPRRMRVIGNGFNLHEYHPDDDQRERLRGDWGIPPSVRLIGHVARYHPDKDHETFLRAAAQLASRRSDVRFILIGKGVVVDNGELAEHINKLGLRDRVHLLGLREDVPRLMQAFDLFTLSSRREGFPNVIGEAMASGVPCVATDVGDVREILGPVGRVVVPGDPSGMAEALESLLKLSEPESQVLRQSARERVERHFGMESIAREYEAMYRAAAGLG